MCCAGKGSTMKKVLAVTVLGLVALVVARKTNFVSYASTAMNKVECQAKRSIPTKFELERIRNEIAQLDGDIDRMVRPVAENKAVIDRMRKEIEKTQANVDEKKQVLLGVTEELKSNPEFVIFGGKRFPATEVKAQLGRDFDSYKRLDTHLQTQRKLLTAKEQALKASHEQLSKVISKKHEYELQLAQLEAEEETLQIARIGSEMKLDDSRATKIAEALAAVRHRHDVERAEVELRTGAFANIPLHDRSRTNVDVDAIRAYLEGGQQPTDTARK